MQKFSNKVAFISGGTAGIDLATAKVLIDQGAQVIFTGRYRETVSETEQELGPSAKGIVSNASNKRDVMELRERVSNISPKIDILFANAGYGKFAPIEAVSEEQFDELFDVLVKGTFFTIQQLLPLINEGGSIILNTSVVTAYGSKNASLYSAAKAAVQSLVKTLAAELTEKKIRVNGVSPGIHRNPGIFENRHERGSN